MTNFANRPATYEETDFVIIGAGLSGIGMAAQLRMHCPHLEFTLIEQRPDLGGTWDLFRYPGIRSDSDMHTLGYSFEPWTDKKAIAGAPAILDYLNRVADKYGIRDRTWFNTKVISADWDDHTARWHVALQSADGAQQELRARFLFLGSGYYDYDDPHDARIPGIDTFAGTVVHPQFWPDDLDYSGKRVVVIGSGATAITLVPAMADKAARVTMLQRTPTWLASRPSRDIIANTLLRVLPERTAYAITRYKNVRWGDYLFRWMRARPDKARKMLSDKIKASLGTLYQPDNFTPPYDPWDQRLCLTPDDDIFDAIKSGKADVVTSAIERVAEDGIILKSGELLPADIIVTATGLRMAIGGKISLSMNGQPIRFTDHYFYKSCMISNIPNFAMAFGYLNAAWTLRLELVGKYLCDLLNLMEQRGADKAMPLMRAEDEPEEDEMFAMSSGYLQRGKDVMPRTTGAPPWSLGQDYLSDCKWMKASPVEDGILQLSNASAVGPGRGEMEWRIAG